jgi:hypothetical protein
MFLTGKKLCGHMKGKGRTRALKLKSKGKRAMV